MVDDLFNEVAVHNITTDDRVMQQRSVERVQQQGYLDSGRQLPPPSGALEDEFASAESGRDEVLSELPRQFVVGAHRACHGDQEPAVTPHRLLLTVSLEKVAA